MVVFFHLARCVSSGWVRSFRSTWSVHSGMSWFGVIITLFWLVCLWVFSGVWSLGCAIVWLLWFCLCRGYLNHSHHVPLADIALAANASCADACLLCLAPTSVCPCHHGVTADPGPRNTVLAECHEPIPTVCAGFPGPNSDVTCIRGTYTEYWSFGRCEVASRR